MRCMWCILVAVKIEKYVPVAITLFLVNLLIEATLFFIHTLNKLTATVITTVYLKNHHPLQLLYSRHMLSIEYVRRIRHLIVLFQ